MEERDDFEGSHNHETYTDEEVKSIAYKYMTYREGHCIAVCLSFPGLLLLALIFLISGVKNNIPLFCGIAGMFGAFAIFVLCIDIFYIYKTYKKEEQRLRKMYGDEFLERVTWFKKIRKD